MSDDMEIIALHRKCAELRERAEQAERERDEVHEAKIKSTKQFCDIYMQNKALRAATRCRPGVGAAAAGGVGSVCFGVQSVPIHQ